ncbi:MULTISPECIES: DUF5994 family protein [Streptomyces]|uniref:DUF5994 family protein n=1 Tax=Streptomyces TaxID=1883 RepID=UPI002075DE31|nr:DUF5994 family protein [Streptomyces sp. STCH 565 A]MCM8551870.1 DUF5994 family protein [Streptomyces sp. STCH 565 A]
MTATVSPPTTPEERLPASPVRLSLAPAGSAPALLDGAWWPRSRDLTAELPALMSVLDPLWGRITRVTVNPAQWPVVPRKVPVAGHVVKVGWFRHEQDEHELLLLSYHVGRWNLLVVPPRTPPAEATWLMAAAGDPRRTASASSLVADAARLTVTAEADRPGEAVWESEGGSGAGALVLPAWGRAVTEAPTERPERE